MKKALLITVLMVAAMSWTMTVEAQCFMHSNAPGGGPGGRADVAGLNLSAEQQKKVDTLHQGCWKECAPLGNRIEQKQVELKGLLLEAKLGVNPFKFGLVSGTDTHTGLTTAEGRFTILMPHPERAFRTVQMSWHPEGWGEDSPWMRMFRNARTWLG
jgi:hypothetical protein